MWLNSEVMDGLIDDFLTLSILSIAFKYIVNAGK